MKLIPMKNRRGKTYRIWVHDEDDLNLATDWMNQFKENPDDPRFQNLELPLAATPPPPDYAQVSESEELKWKPMQAVRIKQRRFSLSLMHSSSFSAASYFYGTISRKRKF